MQGVYTYTRRVATVTTAVNLLEFEGAANGVYEVLRAWVKASTAAAAQQQGIFGLYTTSAVGTGGSPTTVTPDKTEPLSATAASAVKFGYTTPAVKAVARDEDSPSVLAGYLFVPTPEERIFVRGSTSILRNLILRSDQTLTSVNLLVGLRIREL